MKIGVALAALTACVAAPAHAVNWVEVTGFGLGAGVTSGPFDDHNNLTSRPFGLAFRHVFDADAQPRCGGGAPIPTCAVTFDGQSYSLNYSTSQFMSSNALSISPSGSWSVTSRSGQFGLRANGTINLSITRLANYTGAELFGFQAAPVPEPATWATMIAGFALAGAAMRRRRPVVSPA